MSTPPEGFGRAGGQTSGDQPADRAYGTDWPSLVRPYMDHPVEPYYPDFQAMPAPPAPGQVFVPAPVPPPPVPPAPVPPAPVPPAPVPPGAVPVRGADTLPFPRADAPYPPEPSATGPPVRSPGPSRTQAANSLPAGQPAPLGQPMGLMMSKQEDLARVIYDVRSSIPELHGMMIASTDGLPIAHDFHESEAERIAAMAATALGLGKRMSERTNLGELRETVVRGDHGYLVVYSAGENAVLVMQGPINSNLGLMRIEARSASAFVSKVLG